MNRALLLQEPQRCMGCNNCMAACSGTPGQDLQAHLRLTVVKVEDQTALMFVGINEDMLL